MEADDGEHAEAWRARRAGAHPARLAATAPEHQPQASAFDLVRRWHCLSRQGRVIEAGEVLGRLRNLAERPRPGKRFPVKKRRR